MFKSFFDLDENTGSADIAGSFGGFKRPCKEDEKYDMDSGECKKLKESPVGKRGRTGIIDAKKFIEENPEIVSEIKKIAKEVGGLTVLRSVLTNMDVQMNEARPTRIANIFLDMDNCKEFSLIDFHGTTKGFVALIRYKDGNAYEFKVIPAQYSDEFPEYTTHINKRK